MASKRMGFVRLLCIFLLTITTSPSLSIGEDSSHYPSPPDYHTAPPSRPVLTLMASSESSPMLSEGDVVIVRRKMQRRRTKPMRLEAIFKVAGTSVLVGGGLAALTRLWSRHTSTVIAVGSFYSILYGFTLALTRESVRSGYAENEEEHPFLEFGIGGFVSGLALGTALPGEPKEGIRVRLSRGMNVAFASSAVVVATYFLYTKVVAFREHRAEGVANVDEERRKRFVEDIDQHGKAAYEIQHRDKASRMPEWWPVRLMTDEEYNERVENQIRALELVKRLKEKRKREKERRLLEQEQEKSLMLQEE
eukprot:TRINITY_DN11818_c0_g1_i1.p1 TRINITY_DN11818_c0_g1~~TRINITY_DN11818_c0_g1_i1.p1  ORF type:complete len:307 (-),score=57.38 TRINITY_DN11818_c0_g1_i1:12-932(-)